MMTPERATVVIHKLKGAPAKHSTRVNNGAFQRNRCLKACTTSPDASINPAFASSAEHSNSCCICSTSAAEIFSCVDSVLGSVLRDKEVGRITAVVGRQCEQRLFDDEKRLFPDGDLSAFEHLSSYNRVYGRLHTVQNQRERGRIWLKLREDGLLFI